MKITERNPLILTTLGILLLSSPCASYAAKKVKISEKEWKKVITPHMSETYLVADGETLQSISKKLFGKEKYWSKILELNQSSIVNPNKLDPGTILVFFQTRNENTKKIRVEKKPTNRQHTPIDPLDDDPKPRSTEWKELPHQAWESAQALELTHVDKLNFDLRSKTNVRRLTSYDPHFIPASEKLPPLGRIIGSQNPANYFMLTDLVFIKATENMKIGDTYAITQEPIWVSNGVFSAGGYAYYILGKVKIIGVQENTYIGTIIAEKHLIGRNHFLIPVPPRVPEMKPIPGPKPLKALVLLNRKYTAGYTAQNREIFINRGTEDGVQPGMVFRAYFNSDPNNDGSLASSEFIINGDILVTQVSESFSTGLVLYSRNMINHGSKIVLLTDVSDVAKHTGFSQKGGDGLDEIDLLDSRDTPDNKEAREIKQLENWRGNPIPSQDQKNMQEIWEKTADERDLPDPRALRSPLPNPDPLPYLKEKNQSPALKSSVPGNRIPENQIMREELNTSDSDQSDTPGSAPAAPNSDEDSSFNSAPPMISPEPPAPLGADQQNETPLSGPSREINSLPKVKPNPAGSSSLAPGQMPLETPDSGQLPKIIPTQASSGSANLPIKELDPAPPIEPTSDEGPLQPPTLPTLPPVSSTKEDLSTPPSPQLKK